MASWAAHFATQGGWGGGAELTCMSLLIMLMNAGMLTFGVPDYTGKQFTLHYGVTTAGKPREDKGDRSKPAFG